MTFDENGICILESITDVEECRAYIHFLCHEGERHYLGKRDALGWARAYDSFEEPTTYHKAKAAFYESAAKRHQDDLDGIDKTMARIEAHKAKLEAQCK